MAEDNKQKRITINDAQEQSRSESDPPQPARTSNHGQDSSELSMSRPTRTDTHDQEHPETTASQSTHANNRRDTDDAAAAKARKSSLNAILITFTVVILAVFFGIQLVNKTGIFYQEPGKIVFLDSMTELDRDFINTNLTELGDLELKNDVTIAAVESETIDPEIDLPDISDDDNLASATVLYDILLPVTTLDDPTTSITPEAAKEGTLVSVWKLNAEQKLLALSNSPDDTDYYLDNFNSGGFFQYYYIYGKDHEDVDKITTFLRSKIAAFPTQDTVLTLAQTGVTALSRRMNTKLNQVGDATYFSEYISDFLNQFDYVHTSNESSFSTSANGENICSDPRMVDTITSSGINIIELTGNHNQDCGDQAAIDTIAIYQDLGIQTFGGGVSASAAAIPLEIEAKDNHITMLGYNYSTGGYTLDETPGANYYTEEKARADIAAAKERGDFVIVDIQYFECNEYVDTNENPICDYADSAAGDQISFFRNLIDMGADVVVGTAAHQPQTYEQYHGGQIYYGLGNLYFDQSAWPGTTRSIILVHYFWQDQLIQTHLVPTIYDNNFQTRLMDTADAAAFLERLNQARPQQ